MICVVTVGTGSCVSLLRGCMGIFLLTFTTLLQTWPGLEGKFSNNCRTPVLGLGLGVDFSFAWDNKNKNNNKEPLPIFSGKEQY